MDKLIDIAIKWLSKPLAIPIMLQIIILLGMLKIGGLSKSMPLAWQKEYEKIPILSIATTLALSCLLWVLSYFFLYLKYRTKLAPKFGVLWDKNKEPYCPSCSQPLAKYIGNHTKYRPNLWCNKCDKELSLVTDDGERINIIEAKKLL
jgi:hypothetical protein